MTSFSLGVFVVAGRRCERNLLLKTPLRDEYAGACLFLYHWYICATACITAGNWVVSLLTPVQCFPLCCILVSLHYQRWREQREAPENWLVLRFYLFSLNLRLFRPPVQRLVHPNRRTGSLLEEGDDDLLTK